MLILVCEIYVIEKEAVVGCDEYIVDVVGRDDTMNGLCYLLNGTAAGADRLLRVVIVAGIVNVIVENIDKVVFEEFSVRLTTILSNLLEFDALRLQLISLDVGIALLDGVKNGTIHEHLCS